MPTLTIYPYLLEGVCWVFDDQRTGLKEEAFVLGMTEMISKVVDDIDFDEGRRTEVSTLKGGVLTTKATGSTTGRLSSTAKFTRRK